VTRRQLLLASLGGHRETVFAFGHENVLGTSLDLQFAADSEADAEVAEAMALAEIDRLRAVLSTWDPASEASRWLKSRNEATVVSEDLAGVLRAYDTWRERTGGAVDPAVGAAMALWEGAAQEPDAAQRAAAVAAMGQRHWELDGRVATRRGSTPQVFASLAKGYVLDRAAEAAMAGPVRGALINLGGDLVVRGEMRPRISVRSAEEGTAAQVTMAEGAMATSGDYRRGYEIGGRRYSHLLDPRTAAPATGVRSATVMAGDAVTAGALATALAVLDPAEGQRLGDSVAGAEYLLLAANGRPILSRGWGALAQTPPAGGMELAVEFEIARVEGQRYRRPYVAVWIEDKDKFPLRTLVFWVEKSRWWPDLKSWYRGDRMRAMAEATEIAATVASATRAPGKYTVKWDGKDSHGKAVKPGRYAVCIEAAREHGTYQLIRHEMEFNGTAQSVPLKGNVEIASANLEYRKAAR
jgi:thiamine biosynthesis lipoprotein ApbE